MGNTLEYGFSSAAKPGRAITLDVPGDVWEGAADQPGFNKLIDNLSDRDTKFAQIATGAESAQVVIIPKLMHAESPYKQTETFTSVLLVDAIEQVARQQARSDPKLQINLDTRPMNGHDLEPKAAVRIPAAPDMKVAHLATRAMVKTASSLRYENLGGKTIECMHAIVRRDHGSLELTVNSWKGHHVRSERVEADMAILGPERISSHEEQLIVLAGVIAVAHADELIADQSNR